MMNPRDYIDDPIKALVRKYDHAVVAKGERSIFSVKPAGAFQRARNERQWQQETPHVHDTTPGPRPDGRPKLPADHLADIEALVRKVIAETKDAAP